MTAAETDSRPKVVPEKELFTADGYRWFVYNEADTGLRLVCLEDLQTEIIVTTSLANPEKRTAAHKAWAGARHSRAPGMPWEIMAEMGEKGVNPDERLEQLFQGYGHASVGDMARIEIDVVNCPMHLCFVLFNSTSINSGQEKSTRYQRKFGQAVLGNIKNYLPDGLSSDEIDQLNSGFQELADFSLHLFAKHKETLTEAFRQYFTPQDAKEESSMNSRVLDCVRYFLLFGQNSGLSLETSARDWSRIISTMKDSPVSLYKRVATQLERLLTPSPEEEGQLGYKAEAPGLIRHAEASPTVNSNISTLSGFIKDNTDLLQKVNIGPRFKGYVDQQVSVLPDWVTIGDKMVAQYLLTIWPGLDRAGLLTWIHDLDLETKTEISEIIFRGHDNYNEMPDLARTTNISIVFDGFLGELRDFNRHRAWGRFVPMPLMHGQAMDIETAYQILSTGYGLPLYLTEIPELDNLREDFASDLSEYYQRLLGFIKGVYESYGDNVDYSFIVNLLPLAHQVSIWMHGDPKQALYMTNQRVRPGGHINYRAQVFEANRLIAKTDPFLHALALSKKPDPSSRDEFFNRS